MSIFGSRDDDPLLQDDPFAPPGEDGASEADEEGCSGDASSEEGSSEENCSEGASRHLGSLFESGEGDEPAQERKKELKRETLRVGQSSEEPRPARLDRLNALFDAGWRIDRIEHKSSERAPAAEEASTTPITLLFLLRRGQR